MAIRVGRWDCQQCGHRGVLGPETICPNCGTSRPTGVRFYLPSDAEIIKKEKQLQEAKKGADWACSFCGSHNKISDFRCQNCGNDRDAKDDKQLQTRSYQLEEVPKTGETARSLEKKERHQSTTTPTQKKDRRWLYAILIIAAGLLITFLVLSIIERDIKVEVVQMHWERSIETEQYKEVTEEAWQVPSGGRIINSYQAVHHHRRVSDGYITKTRDKQVKVGEERYVCGQRDLGNGYFEDTYCTRSVYETRTERYQEEQFHQEPVYQTKYRYAIYKWLAAGAIQTSGNDKQPQWGNIAQLNQNQNRREAGRKEQYTIIVQDKKERQHEEKLSLDRWKTIQRGDQLAARQNALGQYRGLVD